MAKSNGLPPGVTTADLKKMSPKKAMSYKGSKSAPSNVKKGK